jgi:hypothetical protein
MIGKQKIALSAGILFSSREANARVTELETVRCIGTEKRENQGVGRAGRDTVAGTARKTDES